MRLDLRPIRRDRLGLALAFGLATLAGCQSGPLARRPPTVASNEPALDDLDDRGRGRSPVAVGDVPRVGSADDPVNRHPLLSKPREFYETSGNNKVVKVAAATLVGVPAGIVGELRQIVRGTPQPTRSY